MKSKLIKGGVFDYYSYRCDGPKCHPNPASVLKNITPYTTVNIVEVAFENYHTTKFNQPPITDIRDHGWIRLLKDNHIIHVCPDCQEALKEKLFKVIKKSSRTWKLPDLNIIILADDIFKAITCYANDEE